MLCPHYEEFIHKFHRERVISDHSDNPNDNELGYALSYPHCDKILKI
jgi:hypothetical protein